MKPLFFVGATLAVLRAFPDEVKDAFGFALYCAQEGSRHAHAKPLKGFGGAGVLEIAENYDGDTFRAVYTGEAGRVRMRPPCVPEKVEACVRSQHHARRWI